MLIRRTPERTPPVTVTTVIRILALRVCSATGGKAGDDGDRVSAMRRGASFNLDAVKERIEAARAAIAK
jgi:hypothetical protein